MGQVLVRCRREDYLSQTVRSNFFAELFCLEPYDLDPGSLITSKVLFLCQMLEYLRKGNCLHQPSFGFCLKSLEVCCSSVESLTLYSFLMVASICHLYHLQ